ncbi:hypothetical protein QCB44_03215 [Thiomicrorhabdus sp. zzn3]|uniref:hypothetical protein n=1 Tax=Thiomicrorhabdus sp. zzn3 TaxID=3039775 RepID=UPI0024363593|nr:hypothetical protein [Thiomicrorhabdus sp. zzn3]MDG6777710.1 hypothetical protein [Thiomicrorhabdus sp. zzn3]
MNFKNQAVSVLTPLLIGLFIQTAQAENMAPMKTPQMQQMIHQMHKMQQCLQEVDEMALHRYEEKINALESELRQLCKAGKEAQAQQKAMAFAHELDASQTFQQIEACSAEMRHSGFMPPAPLTLENIAQDQDDPICRHYR